ncbi:MAG: MoxR family ATPase [Myxococcota bacterium]|nr:MoxR family ATPase [Myxococcota bacterium]
MESAPLSPGAMDDAQVLAEIKATRERLLEQIGKVVVGQQRVVELMLTALFAQGHCLFVGVPGLAKTLLVSTTAQALGLEFNRIQFTPDLMPADITGTEILEEDRSTGQRKMRFLQGPVFTNLLLADEINRTPPKTQAALLQAMQERVVSVGGRHLPLEAPFQVFATQNPIEQEGTYPLPEAQLDRFMLSIHVGYPTEEEEREIVRRTTMGAMASVQAVVSQTLLLRMQEVVRKVEVGSPVIDAAVRLARATRPGPEAPAATRQWVQWGAGPRASQYLVLGAKAWAAMQRGAGPEGGAARVEDLKAVAEAVLQHRVLLNFQAEAAGVKPAKVISELVSELL